MVRTNYYKLNITLYLSIVILLLFICQESFAAQITARLLPETFSTQQPARLSVTVSGTHAAELTIPEIEGLDFHQRGTSTQIQIINGKSSSSVVYTYLVQGMAPGDYTIPPITVIIDGTKFASEAITCSVKNGTKPPQQSQQVAGRDTNTEDTENPDNIAFIKMVPEKTDAFVGEIIPTKIEAYFYQGARVSLNSLPALQGEGVLIDILDNKPDQRQEIINNIPYIVVTWETSLTGIKEGSHNLSMELDATLQVKTKQQRQQMPGFEDSFFKERFFDDFFTRYERQPVRAISPTVSLKFKNLPEKGRPENFTGAVGNFTLDVQVTPTKINSGDPVTLRMTVKGTGNFDNVKAPALTTTVGLKSYTATSDFQKDKPHNGKKTFEQAVVVTDPDTNLIPPVVFSFFDPEKNQYQTVFSDPVPLTLKSPQAKPTQQQVPNITSDTVQSPPESSNNQRFPALAPVKLSAGSIVPKIEPLFRSTHFLIIGIVLLTAICILTGYRFRTNHLARNPEILLNRKIADKRKKLLLHLAKIQPLSDREYLDAAQQDIRNLLAILWQTEAAALTTSDITEKLGTDHPITLLFVNADRQSYGALSFSKSEKEQLHSSILKSIETLS